MKLRLPKSRLLRALLYTFSAALILLALDMLWVRLDRRITVSRETTYITAPLKADGMPDYIAYLTDKGEEGVTPENNAAIPFFQTITPFPINPATNNHEILKGYYERLGIEVPSMPQRLPFLTTFQEKHPASSAPMPNGDVEESYIRAHPWSRAEHPAAAEWIDALDKPLSALPVITGRSRWYVPILRPQSDMLITVLIPYVSDTRLLARAAMTRAMLEIQEKRYAEAEADILACHRLARLITQGWTLIEYLVALVIDNDALAADITLANSGISAADLRKYQQQLDALPAWPQRLPDALNMERIGTLDTLIWVAHHTGEAQKLLQSVPPQPSTSLNPLAVALRPSNFNSALRFANQHFDQMVAAARADTPQKRFELSTRAEKQLQEAIAGDQGRFADTARKILTIMIPSTSKATSGDDAHTASLELTKVALALQLYRLDTGSAPASLADLTPKYLSSIPLDPFSGAAFHYQKKAEGFQVYSIGPNFRDDGGKARAGTDPDYDLVIQAP